MNKKTNWETLKYALGPGLLMAAAAVGVSHLVQSTRAGADYGFMLLWAVILANVFKYPFLEFGPRYAIATNETMLEGIKRLGSWAKWVFILFTVLSMFTIQAAVTIVTASLAQKLIGITLAPWVWSAIVLLVIITILSIGRYNILDSTIKLIMVVLSVSTIAAIAFAAFNHQPNQATAAQPELWNFAGVSFLIALMGWMPIPVDAAVWHSVWTHERIKQTGHTPKLRDSLIDFNIGYIGAGILAVAFMSLGALVLYGKGIDLAASGGGFANQFVNIYTSTLGDWTYWIIIICAFSTMFSTTITVTDAYPRITQRILSLEIDSFNESDKTYRVFLLMISAVSIGLLYFLGDNFSLMVDLATSMSFLMAPVLAYINHRLVHSDQVPDEMKPPRWLNLLSRAGIVFLSGFALLFILWNFISG